jgi:hypothetical protein
MSAATQALQPTIEGAAATLDVFRLRCWGRANLVEHGMMLPLQEAVDGLQDVAFSTGLVDLLGQDVVQAIMANAFDLRRRRA